MHQAGAAALTQLLRYDPPDADRRTTLLSMHALLKGTDPDRRRTGCCRSGILAGRPAHAGGGRQRDALRLRLRTHQTAGRPEVPAKAIERAAEAVGAEIAQRDAREIGRAKQLVLPIVTPRNIAKMYVLMDGVQVPVVAAETEGPTGRIEGQRARTRECKLGCVFTQTTVDQDGRPIRDPASTTYVGAIEIAEEFGFRIYAEAWKRGWEWPLLKSSSETVPPGFGIWPTSTFPEPFKSSTSITPASIYGRLPPCSMLNLSRRASAKLPRSMPTPIQAWQRTS